MALHETQTPLPALLTASCASTYTNTMKRHSLDAAGAACFSGLTAGTAPITASDGSIK
jgi:hypothetical protein